MSVELNLTAKNIYEKEFKKVVLKDIVKTMLMII